MSTQTKQRSTPPPDLHVMRANMILNWQAGSHLWGTDTIFSDLDYVAVWIPPLNYVVGVEPGFPCTYTESTAALDKSGNRAKSQPIDEETKWYTAQEFVKRIMIGDPNLVPLLWATPLTRKQGFLNIITDMRSLVSQDAVAHHIMQVAARQKSIEKLMAHNETTTPDPKMAMHMVRVAIQAFNLTFSGRIDVSDHNMMLREIRAGVWSWPAIVELAKSYVQRAAVATHQLPKHPDRDEANRLLGFMYQVHWKVHGQGL